MTRGEIFIENAKCKHGHRSAMSNSAWCELNKICTVVKKKQDMCHNPKPNCQKQITFSPKHFQLEGGSIKLNCKEFLRGHNLLGIIFRSQQLKQQRHL